MIEIEINEALKVEIDKIINSTLLNDNDKNALLFALYIENSNFIYLKNTVSLYNTDWSGENEYISLYEMYIKFKNHILWHA